jgi:hypothetical protein
MLHQGAVKKKHLQPDLFFWRLAALLARYSSLRKCASLAPCHPPKSLRQLVNLIYLPLLTKKRTTRKPSFYCKFAN